MRSSTINDENKNGNWKKKDVDSERKRDRVDEEISITHHLIHRQTKEPSANIIATISLNFFSPSYRIYRFTAKCWLNNKSSAGLFRLYDLLSFQSCEIIHCDWFSGILKEKCFLKLIYFRSAASKVDISLFGSAMSHFWEHTQLKLPEVQL